MGDRDHNRHRPKRGGGAAVLLSRVELGPRLTQCGLGRGLLLYQVATVDMGRKLGAVPLLGGRASCDPIEHSVAWAEVYIRHPYQVAS